NGDLYRIALDGSETVRMTSTKAPEREPAVSPDRLTVAFIRGDDALWLSDLLGGNQRQVLARRPATVHDAATDGPAWAPAGTTLYVGRSAQTRSGYCGSIYRVTASGRGLHRLRRGGGLDMEPAVSPDGQRIALLTEDCEPALCCDVVVVDRQGRPTSDLRKL